VCAAKVDVNEPLLCWAVLQPILANRIESTQFVKFLYNIH